MGDYADFHGKAYDNIGLPSIQYKIRLKYDKIILGADEMTCFIMDKIDSIFSGVSPQAGQGEKDKHWHCLLLIAFFAFTRGVVLSLYAYRGTGLLHEDAYRYLSQAGYFQHYWQPPLATWQGAMMFPGLPILIAALNSIVHNIVLSGFLVSWVGSIASILLFFHLFGDFRMSLIFAVFLPRWVGYSASISSEGLSLFLCLGCLYALRLERGRLLRTVLLIVSGYACVVRNNAALFIYPLIVFIRPKDRPVKNVLYDLCVASVLPCLYIVWNHITVGRWLPPLEFQAAFFKQHAQGYPEGLLSWPGQTFILGLLDKNILWLKKVYVLLHVGIIGAAVKNLLAEIKSEKPHPLGKPFLAILVLYCVFLFSLGGQFGFTSFERHLAQINMVIVFGLFHRHPLRGAWILVLTLIGIVDGSLAGMHAFVR